MVGHGSPNLRYSPKSSAITSDERRLTENGVSGAQLDLFEASSTAPAAATQPAAEPRVDVEALSDAELIGALSQAGLHESLTLVHEIARRRLASGVPALAALCLRHAGFGRSRVVPEQKDAIEALGIIGGREASQALARLIDRGAFEGPGMKGALQEAVRMASPLSVHVRQPFSRFAPANSEACRKDALHHRPLPVPISLAQQSTLPKEAT
jgi:hypothetical protein